MADVVSKFVMRGDQAWIGKDRHGGLIYGVNMKPWLEMNPGLVLDATRLTIREHAGVTLVGNPFIQDGNLCVFVEGLDPALEENFVTFHFYCTDGQHDDRTIYFFEKDN